MNLLNDTELAQRFKKGEVPSRERLAYLLIIMLLLTGLTTTFGIGLQSGPVNKWDRMSDLIEILFTLFGTIIAYRTNARGDDKEFIERYICLSVPITVQVFVLAVAVGFVLFGLGNLGSLPDPETGATPTSAAAAIFIGALLYYYYFRLNAAIKIASH